MSGSKLTFTGAGTVVVTGTGSHSGVTKDHTITVSAPAPTSVVISGTGVSGGKLSMETGGTVTLSAAVKPDAAPQGVTWSSSDASVTVDASGKLTAVSAGTATITATATGAAKRTSRAAAVTATVEVTVTDPA